MRTTRTLAALAMLGAFLIPLSAGTNAGAVVPGENGAIAFNSYPDGPPDIYVLQTDGSIDNITQTPLGEALPDWSPDGTRIAFLRNLGDLETGNRELFVMNADGTGQIRMTNNPARDERPRWSPDGTQILFVSDRAGPPQLFLMDAVDADSDGNGDNVHQLTFGIAAFDPNWSPSGKQIAFGGVTRRGHCAVFTMNADGGRIQQLTPAAMEASEPDWSPNGKLIVFEQNACAGGNSDLVLMRSDGSGKRLLTSDFDNNIEASWSPDGKLIAFTHGVFHPDTGEFDPADIYTIELATGALKNLTNTPEIDDGHADWQTL